MYFCQYMANVFYDEVALRETNNVGPCASFRKLGYRVEDIGSSVYAYLTWTSLNCCTSQDVCWKFMADMSVSTNELIFSVMRFEIYNDIDYKQDKRVLRTKTQAFGINSLISLEHFSRLNWYNDDTHTTFRRCTNVSKDLNTLLSVMTSLSSFHTV